MRNLHNRPLQKEKKIKRTNQQTPADMPNYEDIEDVLDHSWTIFAKNSKIYGNSAVTKE